MESPKENKTKKNKRLSIWTKGGALQLLAALLWIPQAWVLAGAIYAMMTGESVVSVAVTASIWFVVLGLARAGVSALGTRVSYLDARKSVSAMRVQALQVLSMRSPLDIDAPSSGEAASVLNEQAETIVPYLSRFQPAQLKVMIAPIVIWFAVLYHSWFAAVVLLIAAPLIPVFMILIGYGTQKASEKQMLEIGQMNGFLLDRLRGLATIRAFNGVNVIATRLRTVSEEVRRKTMAVLRVAFLSSAVVELFSALGVAFVAVYIGLHLLSDKNLQYFGAWGLQMTLEQGMFILLLAPTFFDPFKELSAVWHDRAAGNAAIAALDKLNQQGVELVGKKYTDFSVDEESSSAFKGALSVVLEQVNFVYPKGDQNILKEFNLNITAGQKVALVAPSGYGKSTILALIAGLLPVTSGRVEVGDITLNSDTADTLRLRMGWISQNPHVFSGTLMQNITLGRKEVTEKEVTSSIEDAALTDVVQGQYNRRLGEGAGVGLSGGEVLRLAMARAVAAPNLGLLLADEPTAHLDSGTAQEVIDSLMALASKEVTLIVATHDERLLPYMDQVIRLEDVLKEEAA